MYSAITIVIVLIVLALGICVKLCSNTNKNYLDKLLYCIVVVTLFIIVFLYLLDILNIPTKYDWSINTDTQRWFEALVDYSSAILTGIISLLLMFWQIKENNEENLRRDNENLRIQNMPILKYDLSTNRDGDKNDLQKHILTNCNKEITATYDLLIDIKNIGLNNVKRIILDFESIVVDNIGRIIGKDIMFPLEKNERKKVHILFDLERNKKYNIKINVYYEDMLKNWYYQEIKIQYKTTNINESVLAIGNIIYTVNEEKRIVEENIPNNNINNVY